MKERPAAAPPGGPPPVVEETEYPPPPPPRGPLLWPWLLLLLLLVLGGLAAWFFISRDNDHAKNARARPAAPARIAVPNVVGLKQATALARIRAAGLTAELRTGRSKLPRGVVFAQQPTAGNQVPRRATVVVSVSNLGTVAVPNVTGLKSQPAVLRLRAAGLLAHLTTVRSTLPLGTVIRQKPVPGTSVARGSTVELAVAKGTATAPTTTTSPTTTTTTTTTGATGLTVPKLVGLDQTKAQRQLLAKGLRATVVYVASGQPENQVVAQKPAPGAAVTRGTRVLLRVSMGPNPGPIQRVPSVVGEDQQTATSDLTDAGFTVVVLRVGTSDQSQVGVVIDQEPDAGSKAPAGGQVTIYVGRSAG